MINESQPNSNTIMKPIFQQIDHIPPEKYLQLFNKKYQKMDHKLINHYLKLISKTKQDYFPNDPIQQSIIKILNQQQIFSARVIFIAQRLKGIIKNPQFQQILSKNNKTYNKFIRLQSEYQQRYLADIGYLSQKCCDFSLKYGVSYQNYRFYSGQKIIQLQKCKGDYRFMQDRHDYIQWMFPNHFQSMFNSHSHPMSYLQVQLFKQSKILGRNMLNSIQIFFDFMGIKINPDYTIQIISVKRLGQAMLINTHNHLRLRRILACLSITGFRSIALELIQFLRELIYGNLSGNEKFRRLKYTFSREWDIYGDEDKQKALKLCFHTQDQFPADHAVIKQYFTSERVQKQRISSNSQNNNKNAKIIDFQSSSSLSSSSFDLNKQDSRMDHQEQNNQPMKLQQAQTKDSADVKQQQKTQQVNIISQNNQNIKIQAQNIKNVSKNNNQLKPQINNADIRQFDEVLQSANKYDIGKL